VLEYQTGSQMPPLREHEAGRSKENLLVQTEAQLRLRTSGYRQLQLVSCEFHEGVLTLRGGVSSFYLKQLAQTFIRGLDGVEEISNRLVVAESPSDDAGVGG